MTPQLPLADLTEIIKANNVPRDKYPVVAVAIRGYYLDSMGKPGVNDRSIYDDAHFIIWPDGIARFQANTDPNGYRLGHGTGASKGMALLKTGIHLFGVGYHRGRPGFRQAEPFTVIRDGSPPYEDCGWHAIDWHDGGFSSTSSLGCQTNPPAAFHVLQPLVWSLLTKYHNQLGNTDQSHDVPTIPYILLDETSRRARHFSADTNPPPH